MSAEEPAKNGNNTTALAKVLGQLNLPTIGAILLMGGGNLFQGAHSATENHREIERAIREVHQLHETLDETERRQLKALANQAEILEALRSRGSH